MKITKLTKAQETRLVEFREEWLGIGLCCDPADFATGDQIIRKLYARIRKPAPLILHFSSPAVCELAANFVFSRSGTSQLDSQLDSQIDIQLRGQLEGQLRGQLDSQLRGQLNSQLASQLDIQLDSQLRGQLYSQLDSQLDSQLYSQLRDQLKPYFLRNRWGSQHWCSWEAFYLLGSEIGVKYKPDDMAALLDWAALAKSIGWWAPFDGICFVSDRPREVHFDTERRLHNASGMSCRYADGWGVFSWHGTRIPGEWITDKSSLTPAVALTHKNVEQRRAACEILGWDAILSALNATVIDADDDPEIGTLVEVELPDVGRERFLRVKCGTGRSFSLPVPPNVRTALEAQSWTWGLDIKGFKKPEVRT